MVAHKDVCRQHRIACSLDCHRKSIMHVMHDAAHEHNSIKHVLEASLHAVQTHPIWRRFYIKIVILILNKSVAQSLKHNPVRVGGEGRALITAHPVVAYPNAFMSTHIYSCPCTHHDICHFGSSSASITRLSSHPPLHVQFF